MSGYLGARPTPSGSSGHDGRPDVTRLAGLTATLGASAERLLIGASVYREPADRNALLFQVGQHDVTAARAPGRSDPAPPYQAPARLDDILAACEAAGLLAVGFVALSDPSGRDRPGGPAAGGPDQPTVFMDRRTASELHRALEAANRGPDLAAAHRRAAGYWRWRSAAWPQDRRADLHDLLEARHHLLQAGETGQACELTEAVCSQLHAWGDLGQEAALIEDTLGWLPARSAGRAAWMHELGKVAQVRADHAEAERCYQQALDIFATVSDRSGVSRCYHSLGVLAQAQGEYTRAERRYQQAADAARDPAVDLPTAKFTRTQAVGRATPVAPPARPSGSATAPRASAPNAPEAAAAPPARTTAPRHAAPFARPGRPTWWRMPGLAAVSAALLALSVAGITGVFPSAGGASLSTTPATAAAGVRQDAAAWVARQVSHSAIVACDPAMCSMLQEHGVAAGDLLVLGAAASDPLGSDVIVATAAVRGEFGRRLTNVYAPVVLASFGSGGSRIDIRVIAPDGAAAYRAALAADLAARRQAGAQLVRNARLVLPALARQQLTDGMVDSRLLITLAALAGLQPVRVISFGEPAPGAGAGVPLRSAEICDPAAAKGIGRRSARAARASAAYLHSVLAFLRAQRAPYLAAIITVIQPPGGRPAVRIEFASPNPLGLLTPGSPATQVGTPS